ncbi:hypothetical protein D1BOALGB6SA_1814 [Olavius sp. associated proteobacterium Delta 1]|nr:hypothetical protein D1BOALGB6SA_1814 [Olavius sp. associated proteobacterium Delta 1]
MGEQHIQTMQLFNAPVDTIFNIVTDHEAFGQVINKNIKRVVASQDDNRNGLGSVRRVSTFRTLTFEETVVAFEQNHLIDS